MDTHKLKCFVAVIEKRSVSAAADALHMTQPPLSMLIKKLEEELQVSLFIREANKLTPTITGELLYSRAKEILANMNSVKRELIESNSQQKETIRIGCSTSASLFVIPSILEQLNQKEKDLITQVQEGETSYLVQRLRDRQLDFVLARSNYTGADIITQTILSEPLVVAIPKNHPLSSNKSIHIEELRNEKFLLHHSHMGTGISDSIIEACNENGFQPNVIYWGIETLPMLLMVQKNLGIAFAPKHFETLKLYPGVALKPISFPKIKTSLSLITLKKNKPTTLVEDFINLIINLDFSK